MMHIDFVEVANFRKLLSTRIDLSPDKTVFVGANNSGKTSAITALRYFLANYERPRFSFNDFSLTHWATINTMGQAWEAAYAAKIELPSPEWDSVLPFLDVWLQVAPKEIHYVHKILPTLDWDGGLLGVRMRYEPSDTIKLQKEYVTARAHVLSLQKMSTERDATQSVGKAEVSLWPQDLVSFLQRKLKGFFKIKAYILDPAAYVEPECDKASPQQLSENDQIEGNPFLGLIRIDEISAQRGFGMPEDQNSEEPTANDSRKLSAQLRQYYSRHLDPCQSPDLEDLHALQAIEEAQEAFNEKLRQSFKGPFGQMQKLGYPGVTDPTLHISTRLNPVEGLKHDAAVQFVVPLSDGKSSTALRLPEDSNGLGYQNLISMVFRLMAFRDSWMRVGKASPKQGNEPHIPPLHLVLIEEPEVHLHTQVQQLFIREAFKILRNHDRLGEHPDFTTQMVVSTHSSHIAHECEFESLRYFRRIHDKESCMPCSRIINLKSAFGAEEATKRFVTRYLRVTHCDLLFADAAILIEGPAERILVPHFVEQHHEFAKLKESYITWLEIGGSHAHRMRSLIEKIGLTALIITDIDSCDAEGKSAPPKRERGYTTRNSTLKEWHPMIRDLILLLDMSESDKIKTYPEHNFSIRVAYQCPIEVQFNGHKAEEALSYTFEDALVMENLSLFRELPGEGLIKKFKTAITESPDISALSSKLKEALKDGDKAAFALNLLYSEEATSLKPPAYIAGGLSWLIEAIGKRQTQLGLAQAGTCKEEGAA